MKLQSNTSHFVRTANGYIVRFEDWNVVIYEDNDGRPGRPVGCCPNNIKKPETGARWVEKHIEVRR